MIFPAFIYLVCLAHIKTNAFWPEVNVLKSTNSSSFNFKTTLKLYLPVLNYFLVSYFHVWAH